MITFKHPLFKKTTLSVLIYNILTSTFSFYTYLPVVGMLVGLEVVGVCVVEVMAVMIIY